MFFQWYIWKWLPFPFSSCLLFLILSVWFIKEMVGSSSSAIWPFVYGKIISCPDGSMFCCYGDWNKLDWWAWWVSWRGCCSSLYWYGSCSPPNKSRSAQNPISILFYHSFSLISSRRANISMDTNFDIQLFLKIVICQVFFWVLTWLALLLAQFESAYVIYSMFCITI